MGIYIIHDDDTQRAPTNRKYNAQELVLTYALYIQIFRHLFYFILFFSFLFFFYLILTPWLKWAASVEWLQTRVAHIFLIQHQ